MAKVKDVVLVEDKPDIVDCAVSLGVKTFRGS